MLKRTFAWLIEMALQVVFGAYILFLVYGTNAEGRGILENVKEDVGFVLFFMLSSAYFATTGWFSVMRPRPSVLGQAWVNVLLFCVHAGIFLVFIGAQVQRAVGVLVLGVGAVAFASLIGGNLRSLEPRPPRRL